MSSSRHYFDHNATTPPDPRVVEAMVEWLGARHGNPSSLHSFGQAARGAVEMARRQVSALLGARPEEVVFTSSGSEANNLAIFGVVERARRSVSPGARPPRLVVASFEHPSVVAAAERCAEAGAEVVTVDPGPDGVVRVEDFREVIGEQESTHLVALMLANNELGTLQPVSEIAALCRERGALLLCDAVQAVGKVPVDVQDLGADLVVIAGHKFHGPIGAAALWMRTGLELPAWLVGGPQERRRRASTENTPAIVGLGRACHLAMAELEQRAAHLESLRERFEMQLGERIPACSVNCADAERLPNTSNVTFHGVDAQQLLIRLDLAGFAVSTGSACSSGAVEASPTLLALGLSPRDAASTLRFSFGMPNSSHEVDLLVDALEEHVGALRRSAETEQREREHRKTARGATAEPTKRELRRAREVTA